MAAHGGTLFLDEIGSASPKVQQALLRCLSLRKVRPLGSDDEIDVDVRLITATNVDPGTLIGKGLLREDLYYRLEVLTIRTPSLRNHKENIPVLVGYFLKQAGRLMNKEDVGITKGALEKMNSYHWPGNVRELMNCVTRSVAMVEEKLIQAEDITLGGERPVRLANMTRMKIEDDESLRQPVSQPRVVPIRHTEDLPPGLNARQKKTFPIILQKQEITRSDYQYIVGNNLPSRTALYDLSDLVKRGILEKTGRTAFRVLFFVSVHRFRVHRFRVQRFRVKDKEGIEDPKSSLQMFIFPSNCQFGFKFWTRPDETDDFLVNTHPKCSPGTRMEP
jgi:DNA-binding NtrC family response regulator